MSLSAAHLDAMLAADMTAEQIVALVKADMAEREAQAEARRARDAERQRRHRESRDVTVTACDNADPFLDKKVSRTLQKIKPYQISPFIPQTEGDWNSMAARYGLPQIQGITGKRLKALKARIAEHGEDAVRRAISNVAESPHWLGENGWLGNFDSLLRPENFQRMLEGAYAGKAAKPAPVERTAEQWEEMAEGYERIDMNDNAEDCRRRAADLRAA